MRNAEENVAQSIELIEGPVPKGDCESRGKRRSLSPADIIDLAERIQQKQALREQERRACKNLKRDTRSFMEICRSMPSWKTLCATVYGKP